MSREALIVAGVRTPIGALGGTLSSVPATELGSICIRAALDKARVASDAVDEVIMGNVVSAGLGQNPARQAAIGAGLPVSVGATTVNKVCGSGLKALMLASQAIRLGDADIVVAGGMESMSLAPHLLPNARQGIRIGNSVIVDSMLNDGLLDAYSRTHMGEFGDVCAQKYGFSRQAQDDFAVRSYTRARRAMADGTFANEIVPVEIKTKGGTRVVFEDEEPVRFNEDKLRALSPAFGRDGTVTAANASSINDGAAALVVLSDARTRSLGLKPLARVVGDATFSQEPGWFSTAPIGAIRGLMDKIQWSIDSVDLFEINEAFAAVTMAAEHDLGLPASKVNIYGGAVALGHPIGASGARVLVTLLNGLVRTGGKRGVACLCVGGGEAVAVAVEACE